MRRCATRHFAPPNATAQQHAVRLLKADTVIKSVRTVMMRTSAAGNSKLLSFTGALRHVQQAQSNPLSATFGLTTASSHRGILTVFVPDPLQRADLDKSMANAEIVKAESLAVAHFNRLVRTELQLGTIPAGGRRQKRLSRYVKPAQRRRLAENAGPHKKYMQQKGEMMSWVHYRRRRQ